MFIIAVSISLADTYHYICCLFLQHLLTLKSICVAVFSIIIPGHLWLFLSRYIFSSFYFLCYLMFDHKKNVSWFFFFPLYLFFLYKSLWWSLHFSGTYTFTHIIPRIIIFIVVYNCSLLLLCNISMHDDTSIYPLYFQCIWIVFKFLPDQTVLLWIYVYRPSTICI